MATMIASDMSHTWVPAEAGEQIRVFDEEFVVKVPGEATGDAYAVMVGSVAPGGGPPLHAHPGNETFYVVSGEFAFTRRDDAGVATFRAGPGAVFHAPGGVPHRFENVSATRSEMLVVGAAEAVAFVRELGAAFPPGAQPDMEKMLAIHARYDVATFHGEDGSRPEPPQANATSARARALAWRFQQANGALLTAIAGCGPAQWAAICADTGWTVGVQAHHIAVGEAAIAKLVQDTAEGLPHPPMPPGMLDAINARHAEEFAQVAIAETMALLREHGAAAHQRYRALSDDQLGQTTTLTAGEPALSVADLIEHLAIGEIERHGAYIRRAIGE